jgi:hypothetical protein
MRIVLDPRSYFTCLSEARELDVIRTVRSMYGVIPACCASANIFQPYRV